MRRRIMKCPRLLLVLYILCFTMDDYSVAMRLRKVQKEMRTGSKVYLQERSLQRSLQRIPDDDTDVAGVEYGHAGEVEDIDEAESAVPPRPSGQSAGAPPMYSYPPPAYSYVPPTYGQPQQAGYPGIPSAPVYEAQLGASQYPAMYPGSPPLPGAGAAVNAFAPMAPPLPMGANAAPAAAASSPVTILSLPHSAGGCNHSCGSCGPCCCCGEMNVECQEEGLAQAVEMQQGDTEALQQAMPHTMSEAQPYGEYAEQEEVGEEEVGEEEE